MSCMGAPSIARIKAQVLHIILHELTLLELKPPVVLLTNCKEFLKENVVVFLGLGYVNVYKDLGHHTSFFMGNLAYFGRTRQKPVLLNFQNLTSRRF